MTRDVNHACDRAWERYGIALDRGALRAIEARLRGGEGMLLKRQPDGSEVTVIRVAGQLVTVAFDPVNSRIKTFKPAAGK